MVNYQQANIAAYGSRSRSRSGQYFHTSLRFLVRKLSLIFPTLVANLLYRLWFFAPRFNPPEFERSIKQKAKIENIYIGQRSITSYHWPGINHQKVLLVHGWSGRSTQFSEIIKVLNDAGYDIHAIDLPAHGHSLGRSTHVYEMAETLSKYIEDMGQFDAVITHSLGGPVAALALRENLLPDKLVCISAPSNMEAILKRFIDLLEIPETVAKRILKLATMEFGKNFLQDLSLSHNIKDFPCPGLIIHDEDDLDISINEADELARHWSKAQLFKTRGLGHRRILRDPQVIAKLLEFTQAKSHNSVTLV